MTEFTEAVERMYRALVREIRTSRPELLDETFSVAEIYQNLVPYRTHRDVIGTEMSGDYEHVLMRLLVGEGDYVTLESDTARRKLSKELDSIHPDTGLYRDFAACEVRLNEDQLPELDEIVGDGGNGSDPGAPEATEPGEEASGPDQDAGREEEMELGEDQEFGEDAEFEVGYPPPDFIVPVPSEEEDEPEEGPVPREPVLFQASSDEDPESDSPAVDSSEDVDTGEACSWCQGALPERGDVQYCPHCGSPVDVQPCSSCGAEVESGWRYCVACGSEVED